MGLHKTIIRIIGFATLFVILFSLTSEVVSQKWHFDRQVAAFYKEPKNTVDVLFLGASSFYRGVSPLNMWDEYGFTSFVRGVPTQPAIMTYYYFLESLNYQQPKVVVLDAYRILHHLTLSEREDIYRRSIEPMKLSVIKIKMLHGLLPQSDINTIFSLLFPFFRYHTRWSELDQKDIRFFDNKAYDPFKGQGVNFNTFPNEIPLDFMDPEENISELSTISEYFFGEVIRKSKEQGIDVVLLAFPRPQKTTYSQHLAIEKFANEHDLIFIDYSLPELMKATNFDAENDMLDKYHLNAFGAKKISNHFGAILVEKFNLEDKRQNPGYEQWHKNSEKLKELFRENKPK